MIRSEREARQKAVQLRNDLMRTGCIMLVINDKLMRFFNDSRVTRELESRISDSFEELIRVLKLGVSNNDDLPAFNHHHTVYQCSCVRRFEKDQNQSH